jgi:hypothetical protein
MMRQMQLQWLSPQVQLLAAAVVTRHTLQILPLNSSSSSTEWALLVLIQQMRGSSRAAGRSWT